MIGKYTPTFVSLVLYEGGLYALTTEGKVYLYTRRQWKGGVKLSWEFHSDIKKEAIDVSKFANPDFSPDLGTEDGGKR